MNECFMQFEGPEKKLEIILTLPQNNLRSNEDGRWDRVAKAGKARILSKISTDEMDAYLLSESSLFVWDSWILMITCGKTNLIDALGEIIKFIDKNNVDYVFYERKNFMYPSDQPSDFEQDVAKISRLFPGKSYRLGPANYDHLHVFYWARPCVVPEEDTTFQILMNDLDPGVIDLFSKQKIGTAQYAGKKSGLYSLYKKPMNTDDYLFMPCGYSLNSIEDDKYFTVHVTPQPNGSYASFDTNITENRDYSRITCKIITIFKPQRFSMVLTTTKSKKALPVHEAISKKVPIGYNLVETSLYGFDCGYTITFLNYIRTNGESYNGCK